MAEGATQARLAGVLCLTVKEISSGRHWEGHKGRDMIVCSFLGALILTELRDNRRRSEGTEATEAGITRYMSDDISYSHGSSATSIANGSKHMRCSSNSDRVEILCCLPSHPMNGSTMRRRRRAANPKAPSLSDTEYFSDKPASTTPDGPSSQSDNYYPSDADSVGHEPDSPSPSGSTLQPPSPGELKASDEADLPDHGKERAWYEFDPSVALALLSPVINWLTGSDHVKNVLLVFLLVFYLHQIIEGASRSVLSSAFDNDIIPVPWSLYVASRPRRTLHNMLPPSSASEKYHRAALSELHTLELFYLVLSILSPLLGAMLLRTVVISFSGQAAVSWFSLSLFVLATGLRPWKHGIERLRQRTADLHTLIHYPPSESQKTESLIERVAQLEAELNSLRKQSESFNSDIYEHVEDAIEMMEIASRRQEKKSELSKAFVEGRLVKLEQNVEAILERMEIRADRPALYRIMTQISTFVSASIEQLSPFLPTWVVTRWRGNVSRSPRSSPKMARSRSSIKLETIPEVATFQPKSAVQPSHCFRIPVLGLALRICHLTTFTLLRVIAYLIPGQIYASRKQSSLS